MMVAKNKSNMVKRGAPKPKDAGKYIDPRTDFGFKRLFGDKELMIAFLNSVLDIKNGIVDLEYQNTVRTGVAKGDRAIIFDLYCSTGIGEHIIVEMQIMQYENYMDRVVYYASRLIQQLGKKGKDWDYELPSVFSVNIVDFKLDKESQTENYLSKIQLMNVESKEVCYDKLSLLFLELPRFTKEENNLKTNVDKWMFALKHLPKFKNKPKKLGDKVFTKLFELAKIAKMTDQQQTDYYKSLHDMSLVKIQFGKMESTIAQQGNIIAQQDNTITVLQKEIEEYRRRYGALDGTIAKPTHTTKVRSRNSADSHHLMV